MTIHVLPSALLLALSERELEAEQLDMTDAKSLLSLLRRGCHNQALPLPELEGVEAFPDAGLFFFYYAKPAVTLHCLSAKT